MSAAMHTPGPWHHVEVPGGDYEIRVASGAWLLQLSSLRNPSEEERQEDEANVRVAAAAPELLEALQAIQVACDDPHGSESGESLAMCMARLLPAARAAIAKATGSKS